MKWQANGEHTARARHIARAQHTRIRLDGFSHNRKPKPQAAWITIALKEGPKHFFCTSSRQAAAVVGNVDGDLPALRVRMQGHGGVGMGELKSVLLLQPSCGAPPTLRAADHDRPSTALWE